MNTEFQPTMLGTPISFESDESEGMITDETETDIYVEHPFFTGWMSKARYFELVEP